MHTASRIHAPLDQEKKKTDFLPVLPLYTPSRLREHSDDLLAEESLQLEVVLGVVDNDEVAREAAGDDGGVLIADLVLEAAGGLLEQLLLDAAGVGDGREAVLLELDGGLPQADLEEHDACAVLAVTGGRRGGGGGIT